jgi:two-component system chemotaxis sensor kinase CheA
MWENDRELIDTYIQESRDHLASIEEDLVELERQGATRSDDLINKIFRAAHSIKGGAGFFEFKVIKELAHKLENVLDLIRSARMAPNPEIVTILLRGFDKLSSLIELAEASESADISEELVALIGLASEYVPESRATRGPARFSASGTSLELQADEGTLERALARGASIYLLRFDLIHDVHRLGRTPLTVIGGLLEAGEILDSALDLLSVGTLDDETPGNDVPYYVLYSSAQNPQEIAGRNEIPLAGVSILRAAPPSLAVPAAPEMASAPAAAPVAPETASVPAAAASATKPAAMPAAASSAPGSEEKHGSAVEETETVRVSVGVLDDLMNLSGELVLVRNELADAARRASFTSIQTAVQRMNAVTAGIQDAVMRTRMQPASNLFARYQRTVRDLARELGKEIDLKLIGRDTELDRSLIETLSDPLTHLVRNACDHGLETPVVRAKAGKSKRGRIILSASHEAGQVVIQVEDDGKGIDAERVAEKVIAMGLISAERVALMTWKEKLYLITLPGLSTASTVSDLSGRGVGMDVVKANVDRLGGRIDIESQPGAGTKVRITLPLTLSIIPALIAGVGDERFALPQAAAAELIHVRAGDAQRRIERMGDRAVLVLRGEVLPLVRLADVIGMHRSFEDPETGQILPDRRDRVEDRRSASTDPDETSRADKKKVAERSGDDRRFHAASDYRIIVVRASGFNYGVIVDRLYDTTEIVVKPLGRHLKGLKEYSGATILGDGTVALIIDPAGLALEGGLTTAGEDRAVAIEETETGEEARGWLLFRNGPVEQCAMPLEAVERVVKMHGDDVDMIGGDLFLRLDGVSLPVFPVSLFTGLARLDATTAEACVLCRVGEHRFGFLASPPVDSVAAEALIDTRSVRKPGVTGTTVIQGRTTVVIDPPGALGILKPEWFETAIPGQATTRQGRLSGEGDPGRSAEYILPNGGTSDKEAAVQDPPEEDDRPLIVLAEDSDFFRSMVVEILKEAGYQVRQAQDGQEALELVRELGSAVQLVVTDVEMPRLDGRGLSLSLHEEFPDLPVVALTSLASELDEKNLRDAGVSDFLVKLDREALLGCVSTHLNGNK